MSALLPGLAVDGTLLILGIAEPLSIPIGRRACSSLIAFATEISCFDRSYGTKALAGQRVAFRKSNRQ